MGDTHIKIVTLYKIVGDSFINGKYEKVYKNKASAKSYLKKINSEKNLLFDSDWSFDLVQIYAIWDKNSGQFFELKHLEVW